MNFDTRQVSGKIGEMMQSIGRPVKLMEVCGTHTMAIFRHGIRSLLPESIHLLSGPGCPVCVTSLGDIEAAVSLAQTKGVLLTTFGDMMRVPGRKRSLGEVKAEGADVRVVYSPLDALDIAESHKQKEIVFFAAGFETTSPLSAATLFEAERRHIGNFSIFSAHKRVPPALRALLKSGDVQVDGFILPGHVSTVIGSLPYGFLAETYRKPSVITGFEASDVLSGILMILNQIRSGKAEVSIQYASVVREKGNPRALAMIEEFFQVEDAHWRGLGAIPESGLGLKDEFRDRDAIRRFSLSRHHLKDPSGCRCGDVLRGAKLPTDCSLFGKGCTPEKPVGACMVSAEGSCAAYYQYM